MAIRINMFRKVDRKMFKVFITIWFVLSGLSQGLQAQEHGIKLPMISAHRGASHVAPENTLTAFSKAIAEGADFIEIDVRTTLDGVQVIMHDASLKRTTGLDAKVENTSLVDVKKLSSGRGWGKAYENEKVPTLDDVCSMVDQQNKSSAHPIKLYVDCKVINVNEVIRILKNHTLLDSAIFFGDMNTLTGIKLVYQHARIMPAYPGKDQAKNVVNKIRPYAFDVAYMDLNEETISLCHANGVKVFSDLLGQNDKPQAYKKAIQLGIDLIQTDDVSGVRQVYNEFESVRK
jgi:glycerophosphoryl diester phosphodiesterase